jgi:hypothetical protein
MRDIAAHAPEVVYFHGIEPCIKLILDSESNVMALVTMVERPRAFVRSSRCL